MVKGTRWRDYILVALVESENGESIIRQVLPAVYMENDHVFVGSDRHDPQGASLFLRIRHDNAVHMKRIDRSHRTL
mgnify:CR=1 FL=1